MNGEEMGRCEICGNIALPKFGVMLCKSHGTWKHAKRVKEQNN